MGPTRKGPSTPNMKHIPQTIITVPNRETMYTPYLGTLDPRGTDLRAAKRATKWREGPHLTTPSRIGRLKQALMGHTWPLDAKRTSSEDKAADVPLDLINVPTWPRITNKLRVRHPCYCSLGPHGK